MLNYSPLFTPPRKINLETNKISQTLWKLCIFSYRVRCSLPKPLNLNSIKSLQICPPSLSYLTIWRDSFQSTTPTTLPLLFSLRERQRWWIQQTDLSFGDREVSFSQQREEGIASVGCTCPYLLRTPYKSQGTLQVTWISPQQEGNQMASISTCGTALNDVRTNPF